MTWEFFLEHWGAFHDGEVYLRGEIPRKKLENAIATYAPDETPDTVWLLYDNTVFGGAKDGLLLSRDAVSWRENPLSDPVRVEHAFIRDVNYDPAVDPHVISVNHRTFHLCTGDDRAGIAESIHRVLRAAMMKSAER